MSDFPSYLKSCDSAFAWATENLDLSIDEDDPEVREIQEDEYRAKACTYATFAKRAAASGRSLMVYRMICVPARADVELDNLGKAWSLREAGAGCYNPIPHRGATREVLVIAEVSPRDVDWDYGFASFMYYGEEQWEISMEPDSPVWVLAVGDEQFDRPVRGNTGHAREEWRSKRR